MDIEMYCPGPDFFRRNGEIIPKGEVYERIEAGTLAADKELFASLPGDFFRALLAGEGKVSKRDFEKWMEVDKYSLYWEAQIALLLTDEEYAQKFIDWEYIRSAAEPQEWLSFLRDLPQYAAEADWDKLNAEGAPSSWRALLEVRPELAKYRRKQKGHAETTLEEYKRAIYEHLTGELKFPVEDADIVMEVNDKFLPEFFAEEYSAADAAVCMAHNW